MTEATLSAKVTADIADFAKKMDTLKNAVDQTANAAGVSFDNLAERGGGAMDRLREKLTFPAEMKLLATTVASTAAAVEGAFFAIAKSAAAATEQIEHVALKTGMSAASLEQWQPLLNRTGTSIEQFATAYRALSKDITAAQDGNEEAVEKFRAMGLAVNQLGNTDAVLAALAERLASIQDPAQRAQVAVDLLGRSGLAMLPTLLAAKGGLAESAQQAQAWGLALDDLSRNRLLAFDDSLDDVNSAIGGLKTQVALAVQPSLQVIADAVLGMLTWFGKLSEGVRQVVSVFTLAFAVGGPITVAAAGVAAALGAALSPILIGGAVITALIAAVTLIVANWQKIKDTGTSLWNGLAGAVIGAVDKLVGGVDAAIGRLNAILDGVRAKTEAVKGFFRDLYTAVVGRSYIPDMVDEIGQHMDRLTGEALVDPVTRATDAAGAALEDFAVRRTVRVGQAVDLLAGQVKRTGTTMTEGLTAGLNAFVARTQDAFVQGVAVAEAGARAMAQGFEQLFTRAIEGQIRSVKDVLNGLLDIAKMVVQAIMQELIRIAAVRIVGGFLGSFAAAPATTPAIPELASGGIVTGPTLALIGEAGPEAVVPLKRHGSSTAQSTLAADAGVTVVVNNYAGNEVKTSSARGPDGRQMIYVTIREAVRGMLRAGELDSSMQQRFALRPQPVGR